MTDRYRKAESDHAADRSCAPEPRPAPRTAKSGRKSLSMHDDVPVWYDCCSCEAEPYWQVEADAPEDSDKQA